MKRIRSAALLLAAGGRCVPGWRLGHVARLRASGATGDAPGPLLGRPDAPDLQVGQAGDRPGLRHGARAGLRGRRGGRHGLVACRRGRSGSRRRSSRRSASGLPGSRRSSGQPHHSHGRPRHRGREPRLPAGGHGRRHRPRAASERRGQLRATGRGPPHLLQLGVPRGAAGVLLRPEHPRPDHGGQERADRADDPDQRAAPLGGGHAAQPRHERRPDPRPRQDAPAGPGHRAALARLRLRPLAVRLPRGAAGAWGRALPDRRPEPPLGVRRSLRERRPVRPGRHGGPPVLPVPAGRADPGPDQQRAAAARPHHPHR